MTSARLEFRAQLDATENRLFLNVDECQVNAALEYGQPQLAGIMEPALLTHDERQNDSGLCSGPERRSATCSRRKSEARMRGRL